MTLLDKITKTNLVLDRFSKDIEDKYDYKFRITSPSDYELRLVYRAKAYVLSSVFKQVSKHLSRVKQGLDKTDPDLIEKFDVPPEMYNRVHTAIKSNIDAVGKLTEKDGIKILRSSVNKCVFERHEELNKTFITINVGGIYVKSRD